MQSRIESFIEQLISTAFGFIIALLSQLIIFPMYEIHIPIQTNLAITAWFTIVSIVRSYIVRRLFNYRTIKKLKGLK